MVPKEVPLSKVKHHWEIYFFIIPTLVLICMFQYYPAVSGVFHSFFRWNGADISEFNFVERIPGTVPPSATGNAVADARAQTSDLIENHTWGGNYRDLVTSTEFWDSFRVAFILGIWNVIKMIPAVLVAVCIHRCRSDRMQFFYRAMFVVPMVIPALVIVLIWRSFFFEATSGYLNRFLYATGAIDLLSAIDRVSVAGHHLLGGVFLPDPATGVIPMPAWLGDPRLILTACVVWGFPWVGSFAILTHLAKLQGIDKQIYEAGDIDGVNWWSKFRHIELPLISGSIYILLVFTIIGTIRDAGIVLALAGLEGGPGGRLTVPALFMMRKAFMDQHMGYACAVGIVLTLVVMALQKISAARMNWEFLKPRQRFMMRFWMILGAGLLLYSQRLPILAVVLLAMAVPFRSIGKGLQKVGGGAALDIAGAPLRAVGNWRERRLMARLRRRQADDRIRPLSLMERIRRRILEWNKHLVIWLVLLFALLPVYLMAIVSVKSNQQFYEAPATLTQPYHWDNWAQAWESVKPCVANSLYVSTAATFLTLVFAVSGAYFFARAKMPFSGLFWNAILVLMMMPMIANLVPLFRLLSSLNLLNTLSALIMVGASAGQIMGIFVLRQFISDIPQDLFDAAEIDGANHFRQMVNVVLPLSGPILGTVGVMHFVYQWNDFVLPLIIMRDHHKLPIMVQLLRMAGEYIKLWGPMMAGYTIASVPVVVLFVFSMKLYVRGMTEGAIK